MRNLPAQPRNLEESFDSVISALFKELGKGETLSVQLSGEESQFVRFNAAKVRQTGTVCDASMSGSLASDSREVDFSFPVVGQPSVDLAAARAALVNARAMLAEALPDPFWVAPSNKGTSREVHEGRLLDPAEVPEKVISQVQGLDFVGIYQGGRIVRGMANSTGTRHWFATETFALDYSLFLPNGRAVSTAFAGREWDEAGFRRNLADARMHLEKLSLPQREVPRGKHRIYLAPSAVATLGQMMLYSFGLASQRQKYSALLALSEGRQSFAPIFSLTDDFSLGMVPRFSEDGTVAPEKFQLVQDGKAANVYVSERSAKEYNVPFNGSGPSEYVRSPVIGAGQLPSAKVLETLGTGLYVSDLHYLNFSDRPNARITGMTRFACFWVENGKIAAPIRDLRFDVTLFQAFGEGLEALTAEREFIPETSSYGGRELGGFLAPGALIRDFEFTL